MASALYDISTGEFTIWEDPDDGGVERCIFSTCGYSGMGKSRNRPGDTHLVGRGPIPVGKYYLELVRRSGLAPPVFHLVASRGNQMFGRSGFLIHGDNPTHDASRGCIILWRSAREAIAEFAPKVLEVCASRPLGRGLEPTK